jgi:2-C-methyl-D-erythritol 4-phosphate cytidylyltransferase
MSRCAALIVAAGSSLRFGQDKLTALVQGQPLLSYSLRAFHDVPFIQQIVLVVAPGRERESLEMIDRMSLPGLSKKITVVTGGSERYASVQCGLSALSSEITSVAIHDGARPLISPAMIEYCFQEALQHGAAALAAPVTDTLHRVDAHGDAQETVDRRHLWAVQTPQIFRRADLIAMQPPGAGENLTDEVSLFLQRGGRVHLVENREPNIKVTYPSDLDLVNRIVRKR